MGRLLRILWRWSLALLLLVAVIALCEDLLLRYRMKRGPAGAVLDQVTIYDAAELKDGRLEIYFDHPVTQRCVRAIFPHFGDPPCWYVRRHPVRLLARLLPPAHEGQPRAPALHHAVTARQFAWQATPHHPGCSSKLELI